MLYFKPDTGRRFHPGKREIRIKEDKNMTILAEKNGFLLTKEGNFYQFGHKRDFSSFWGVPVSQWGTKEAIKAELERWKNEIDFDNSFMLEVENAFLAVLK